MTSKANYQVYADSTARHLTALTPSDIAAVRYVVDNAPSDLATLTDEEATNILTLAGELRVVSSEALVAARKYVTVVEGMKEMVANSLLSEEDYVAIVEKANLDTLKDRITEVSKDSKSGTTDTTESQNARRLAKYLDVHVSEKGRMSGKLLDLYHYYCPDGQESFDHIDYIEGRKSAELLKLTINTASK